MSIGQSDPRIPSCDHLRPQDILCFEGLGVLELGYLNFILALRNTVLNLTPLTARPPGGVQGRHAKLRSFAPISNSNQLSPQNRSMHTTQEALDDVSSALLDVALPPLT